MPFTFFSYFNKILLHRLRLFLESVCLYLHKHSSGNGAIGICFQEFKINKPQLFTRVFFYINSILIYHIQMYTLWKMLVDVAEALEAEFLGCI